MGSVIEILNDKTVVVVILGLRRSGDFLPVAVPGGVVITNL